MKKSVIYARVSTEKQEEQKTIESQLAELREICKKDGATIVKEYIDNGISGGVLARPSLDRLRDEASSGLFAAVYILSPDRLARKYIYQAIVMEELKKKGIEIIFLNKPVTDNPEDQLLLGIEGLIAEYERAKIMERTRRGRFHRARNGEILGGSGPYGYLYVKKTKNKPAYYEIDEEQADIVRMIFSLYLEHKSTAKVVKILAERKIRTKNHALYWSKGLIHKLLTNECYIGTAYYNKHDKGAGKWRVREREEWIPIKVPEIIDEETFLLVQKTLKSHRGGKRRRNYILSGLVRCKHCGSTYIGASAGNNNRNFYYRCGNIQRRFPLPRNCFAKNVRADKIENAILNTIRDALARPQIFINHILNLTDVLLKKGINAEKEKEGVMNKKKILEDKKAKLLELYLETVIEKDAYLEKKQEVEERVKDLDRRMEELVQRVPRISEDLIIKNVHHFCELAKKRIDSLSPDKLHEFLAYLIDEIIFNSKEMEVKISGHIPVIDKTDIPSENHLFQFSPALSGETRNKYLRFELKVNI